MASTFFIGLVAVFVFYLVFNHFRKKKQAEQELFEDWGKPVDKDRDWFNISLYHDLLPVTTSSGRALDDKTWNDLNMNDLFERIDRTSGLIGQQYLYDLLKRPTFDDEVLRKREKLVNLFEEDHKTRTSLQLELRKLTSTKFWNLPNLFLRELAEPKSSAFIYLLSPLATFVCIGLSFIHPYYLTGLLLIFLINQIINHSYKGELFFFTSPLFSLSLLLKISGKISNKLEGKETALDDIRNSINKSLSALKKLSGMISWFSFSNANPDDLMSLVYVYLDNLFLIEVNLYYRSIHQLRKNRDDIQELFDAVGMLDAMQSVASFRTSLPYYCKPEFKSGERLLSFENIYHPILEEPVPNDLHIRGKSVLITGSNMAGKSTFLKTLGINQIMSQTLYLCCAEKAEMNKYHLISSMKVDDDLVHGKSYYITEVERIKELIEQSISETNNLFLIDEIFRGTNTIERVSASREVLMYLDGPKNMVITSTHDLELLDLLDGNFEFYHFREIVTENSLDFDYKIKKGATSTRNAIALLKLTGYPESLVQNAYKLSEKLEAVKN